MTNRVKSNAAFEEQRKNSKSIKGSVSKWDVAGCKQRLPLPELWRYLALRGEPRKSCRSPFREEKRESFSVFEKDGLWFWKDHGNGASGDEVDLVMMAKGIEKADALRWYHEAAGVKVEVRESRKQTGPPLKVVAVYDYRDAEGRLVHQTLRLEPKSFRQRRPAVAGMCQGSKKAMRDRDGAWWLWSLEGIEPVLYGLPELLARRDERVILVEGEKDAEAVRAAGGLATTCPMGARKWRKEYTEVLAGRRVLIWGDRDSAGEAHVMEVGKALVAAGCRVEVVDWDLLDEDLMPKGIRQ